MPSSEKDDVERETEPSSDRRLGWTARSAAGRRCSQDNAYVEEEFAADLALLDVLELLALGEAVDGTLGLEPRVELLSVDRQLVSVPPCQNSSSQ